MSKLKVLTVAILAAAMVAFGAVTVSAVSGARAGEASERPAQTETMEEEMAVGAYYADQALAA